MTKKELESFLSSGVIDAEWPAKTFIWATVKDAEGRIIHQQKYVCQNRQGYILPHAERQLIDKLTKGYRGSQLINRTQKIEIFTNYSPCSECADQLLQLKSVHPRLGITIKCAHLYRVEQGQSLDRANIEGLQTLQSAGIHVKSFTGNDWLQLLSEASSLCGYDYLQPLAALRLHWRDANLIAEGRQAADEATRQGLEVCRRTNMSLSAKANELQCLYERAIAEAHEDESDDDWD